MSDSPRTAVIVVSAGSGTRLGAGMPKAFVEFAGRSILRHALDGVFGMKEPAQVIVVAPRGQAEDAVAIGRAAAGAASGYLSVVEGTETRQGSVAAGLAALAPHVETVLVHDAARALTPPEQLDAVAQAVASTGVGVVPALAVTDTIKRVDADESVQSTVDRGALRAVQTPQGFPRELLDAAYAAATEPLTDDAALVTAFGGDVTIIAGDERARSRSQRPGICVAPNCSSAAHPPRAPASASTCTRMTTAASCGLRACCGQVSRVSPGTATATPCVTR